MTVSIKDNRGNLYHQKLQCFMRSMICIGPIV